MKMMSESRLASTIATGRSLQGELSDCAAGKYVLVDS